MSSSMRALVLSVLLCVKVLAPGVVQAQSESEPIEHSASGPATPEPLDQCTHNSELIEAAYIKAVKRAILWKLGFTEPPVNPTGPIFVREEQLQEYKAIRAAQDRVDADSSSCTEYNQYARTIRVFFLKEWNQTDAESHQPHRVPDGEVSGMQPLVSSHSYDHTIVRYRLTFEVNISDADIVSSAELRLYKKPRPVGESHLVTEERVEVFLITQPEDIGLQYWGQELPIHVMGQNVPSDSEGYVLFDVYEALERWKNQDKTNLAREIVLEVGILCPDGMKARYIPSIEFDLDTPKLSQLVMRTYKESDRKRRQGEDPYIEWCRENPSEFNCCLKDLQINFREDFGWSWVIQPKSFHANYCKGFCPYNWSPSSIHSVVVSRLIRRNPTAAPRLCCVPNQFTPLVLYLHLNGSFVFVTLDDVQVRSCICR